MNKLFYAKLIILAAVCVGVFLVIGKTRSTADVPVDPRLQVLSSDHVQGSRDASVVIIEYIDLECPTCKGYHPLVKDLVGYYGDNIAYVPRHFPIGNIHPNAMSAAIALESAGLQDRYFEMMDLLFEEQDAWKDIESADIQDFVPYAAQLGLDVKMFIEGVQSQNLRKKVEDQYLEGIAMRVRSTPTFFVNGKRLSNPRSSNDFYALIDPVLEQEN